MSKNAQVVLGVTASIAIYKSCDIIRRLKEKGCCVRVVMTKEAEELIRPIVFQSLSGNNVCGNMFETPDGGEIEHISLAENARVILIAPATANVIAKLAAGICDDLLTSVVLATKVPIILAPAMNEQMYRNPITQGNIARLKKEGMRFVGPKKGLLACGKTGVGCLAEVETIVEAVRTVL